MMRRNKSVVVMKESRIKSDRIIIFHSLWGSLVCYMKESLSFPDGKEVKFELDFRITSLPVEINWLN